MAAIVVAGLRKSYGSCRPVAGGLSVANSPCVAQRDTQLSTSRRVAFRYGRSALVAPGRSNSVERGPPGAGQDDDRVA